jgi:GNAT superfamily N-acetyltransferase
VSTASFAHDEFTIQPVRPSDVPAVVAMAHELAAYEKAPESCHLTSPDLSAALFGPHPALFGHVALDASGAPVATMLWFLNFSTWDGRHGIYLEDLYVRPAARKSGLGRRMLAILAGICVQRGYTRLQWSVLDWNPARDFYATLGALATADWVPYRLVGPALIELARTGASDVRPGA